MKDYYSILGVGREATEQDIKTAYKKLSVKFHPDKNNGDSFYEERFKEVQEAYEILGNPLKRANYNAELDPRAAREHLSKIDTNYPIITIFDVSKKALQEGEPINLRWQTIHANEVEIEFLGKVAAAGTKTIRVPMMYNKEKITITLTAYNTFINQKIQKAIEIKNKSFKDRQVQLLYEGNAEVPMPNTVTEKVVTEKTPQEPEKLKGKTEEIEEKEEKAFDALLHSVLQHKEEEVSEKKTNTLDLEEMRALAKEERLNGIKKVIAVNESEAQPGFRWTDMFIYVVLIVLLIFITLMSIFVYQMNPF